MKRDNDIVHQLDAAEDTVRRNRLRAMQRIALGLLVAAALLFALARSRHGQHPAWGCLEAFAEAAMVGALADWFAVVALFRHPLGIPLWHTAIIPASRDSIGASLGGFVENHFVTEDGIVERIRKAGVAMRLGEWLLHPVHARDLAGAATGLARQLVHGLDDARIRGAVRDIAGAELARLDLSQLAGAGIDALVAAGKPQELVDALLDRGGAWLADDANHDALGRFLLRSLEIENVVLRTAVNGVLPNAIAALRNQVALARQDRAHPLRERAGEWIADCALRLKADPAWRATVARCQRQALGSDGARATLDQAWDALRARLLADLQERDSALARAAQGLAERAGRWLVTDAAARAWLDTAVESLGRLLVRRHRGEVAPFIEQQLAKWTPRQMSDRIELAIGRDLQFIRINGTLVGGLAGLLIHVLVTLA